MQHKLSFWDGRVNKGKDTGRDSESWFPYLEDRYQFFPLPSSTNYYETKYENEWEWALSIVKYYPHISQMTQRT